MLKFKPLPPLERLNQLIEIDNITPENYGKCSGLICKDKRQGTRGVGKVAGSRRYEKPRNRSVWVIRIDGSYYYVARIIYYMYYKIDPGNLEVDHRDRNTDNNNIDNLRLDVYDNIQDHNKNRRQDNKSGITGVHWRSDINKWAARLRGKNMPGHLGLFDCKREAAKVVNEAIVSNKLDKIGKQLVSLSEVSCNCRKCVTSQE
jgi:hypothetical protein